MLNKIWLFISFLIITSLVLAQDKYWISFTDKNNSPYSINNPSEFLSQKAVERRQKQNIPVVSNDLPVNQNYVDSIKSFNGIQILNKSKWLNGISVQVNDTTVLNNIFNLPFVDEVKLIYKFDTASQKISNKWDNELFVKNNALLRTNDFPLDYGYATNQIEMLNGDFLHEAGFKGEGMDVAIIDAGFMNVNNIAGFQQLWAEGRILGYKDFVNLDDGVFDEHSHGTSVLSTMAFYEEGVHIGVAPNANFWLLRSEDAPTEYLIEEYNWVSAAEYADSVGAYIINTSLGYTEFDDSTMNHVYNDLDGNTTVITKGADIAASKGMLVVNSAGNSGNDPWYYISAPADADSVLTVGAVDASGIIASFSSRGPTADGRIKPDVCAQGQQTTVAISNGNVVSGSGTSFSSPIITGMATCLWQAYPDLTAWQIRQAIVQSAHIYHKPNNDYGYGIPNFKQAYFNLAEYSVTNQDKDELIQFYPNPVANQLNVVLYASLDQTIAIKVFDLAGKMVYEDFIFSNKGRFNKISIPAKWNKGCYILYIKTTGETFTRKVLKL